MNYSEFYKFYKSNEPTSATSSTSLQVQRIYKFYKCNKFYKSNEYTTSTSPTRPLVDDCVIRWASGSFAIRTRPFRQNIYFVPALSKALLSASLKSRGRLFSLLIMYHRIPDGIRHRMSQVCSAECLVLFPGPLATLDRPNFKALRTAFNRFIHRNFDNAGCIM